MKKYFTKKNIIIATSILAIIIICITLLIIYLVNNTLIFKKQDEISSDLKNLQEQINNKLSNVEDIDLKDYADLKSIGIDNPQYANKVGISNGKVYIKDSSNDKVKNAIESLEIGKEQYAQSEDGILVVDAYEGTQVTECKVVNSTQDIVNVVAFSSNNLCEEIYTVGSIKDYSEIEQNKDNLIYTRLAKNTTYTITNNTLEGTNITFFFDKDKKYIGNTKENTFTTDENMYYAKFITENEPCNGTEIMYDLVLGSEPGMSFEMDKTDLSINVKENANVYLPFNTEKTVIYSYGGDIGIKYVTK